MMVVLLVAALMETRVSRYDPFPNYGMLQRTRPRIDATGSSIDVDHGGSDDSDDGCIP